MGSHFEDSFKMQTFKFKPHRPSSFFEVLYPVLTGNFLWRARQVSAVCACLFVWEWCPWHCQSTCLRCTNVAQPLLGRKSKSHRNSILRKLSTFYLLFSLPPHHQIWRRIAPTRDIFRAIEKSTLEIFISCNFATWFLQGVLQVRGGFRRVDS